MFKVAIIGKPNVGKSTLFNKLCGKRLAITHDRPGVTRDAKVHNAKLGKLEFKAIDTAGLDDSKDELTQKMVDSSMSSAKDADVIMFVIDGRHGIQDEDKMLAKSIRKLDRPIILVANKCENPNAIDQNPIYKLGFSNLMFISAEHSIGFRELEQLMRSVFTDIEEKQAATETPKEVEHDAVDNNQLLRFAIIGRPNVGKSTLFNRLLGFDRSIVSHISGTTRDAINHFVDHKGQKIEIIDTAGLRKKNVIQDQVELLSSVESINALRRAQVTALVIDGTCPLEKQDLSILRVAINEGKPAILIVNKCDLISDIKAYKAEIQEFVDHKLFELKGMQVLYISALKEKKLDFIWDAAIKAMDAATTEINTGALNRWLDAVVEAHIPPLASNGRRIRLKYATQTGTKPPTFTLFGNMVNQLPESYIRYLYNSMRDVFGIYGVPIRIRCKSGDNPYEKNKR